MVEFQRADDSQKPNSEDLTPSAMLLDALRALRRSGPTQDFLNQRADDPRRSLTKEERSALKEMYSAIFSHDDKKLETIMNSGPNGFRGAYVNGDEVYSIAGGKDGT